MTTKTPWMSGAPAGVAMTFNPSNRSMSFVVNRRQRLACWALRMCTENNLPILKYWCPLTARSMQMRISGGFSETELNALTGNPYGRLFGSNIVTMVTPVANSPITRRNSFGATAAPAQSEPPLGLTACSICMSAVLPYEAMHKQVKHLR